ncbi:MAG: alpha/beta fold hydrolase [Desulfosalsimonadaceae bacterium]
MIKKIDFHADNFRLNGTLHFPENATPGNRKIPVVVGSHGLLSDGESPKQKVLAERMNEHGIAFFRFDHRGCGKSDGLFATATTYAGRVNDLASAISTVMAHPGIGKPLGLFGSSMGGAVCLGIAEALEIVTIVTLAAPVRLEAIRIPPDIDKDPQFDGMKVEQMAFDVSGSLGKIRNILVFHGDADQVVSFSNASEIYEKAASPKRLIRFPGGDHAISAPDFQKTFIEETVAWFADALTAKP